MLTREVDREIGAMVETLVVLLHEQLNRARGLAALIRKRLLAEARGNAPRCEECLELEREALLVYAHAERERIAALAEIGLALGVRDPSRLRVAQLIFYVSPEVRDELLEVRESLRDVADELAGLRAWGAKLEHHSLGKVILYVAPEVFETRSKRWLIERLRAGEGDIDPSGDSPERAGTSLSEEI